MYLITSFTNWNTSLSEHFYNYFIGYGSQHDAKLLGVLSDFEKSSYHYIDALEKTGFVFGEILHSITHKVLYDCEIVVEHGVIYNYNTNLYTNKLYIGDIVGESNKVYHLFTDHPSTCYVHLKMPLKSLEINIFQETSHELNFVNYARGCLQGNLMLFQKNSKNRYNSWKMLWKNTKTPTFKMIKKNFFKIYRKKVSIRSSAIM